MNYYERYVGDFQRDTGLLSCAQVGAYDRLLDHYYGTETPLPADHDALYRLCRAMSKEEKAAVKSVVDQFFPLSDTDGLRHNGRADEEITKAQARIQASKHNGGKGGRPHKNKPKANPTGTQQEPNGLSEHNPTGTQQGTHPGVHHVPDPIKPKEVAAAVLPAVHGSTENPPPSRSTELAIQLRSWEKTRGKMSKTNSQDPRLMNWAEQGVTDAQLREAYDIAVADREGHGDSSPMNTGFLDVFIAKLLNPPEAKSAVSLAPAAPPAVCYCGREGSKRIGRIWYCTAHDQYSERTAA